MHTIRPLAVLALIACTSTTAFGVEPTAALPIALSQDAAAPVIVLDFDDALSAASRRDDLYLAIYADGQAIVSAAGEQGRQIKGVIPQPEFRQLLSALFVEYDLLNCRTSELQQSIRSARRERQRPEPGSDAATTVIRVRSTAGAFEVRCHALGLTANQLPELTQVQDLFACQQRLQNVAAIIRAGGYEHVNAVLSSANRRLQSEAPRAESLTMADLSLVDLRPDGTRYLQFSRLPGADGLQPHGGFVMISVYQPPGQSPEITVTADAS